MQTRFPNPKSQILRTGIWFLERVLTTKISPTENCHGQNELRKTQIPVVRANYFRRGRWLFPQEFLDFGFKILETNCIIPLCQHLSSLEHRRHLSSLGHRQQV